MSARHKEIPGLGEVYGSDSYQVGVRVSQSGGPMTAPTTERAVALILHSAALALPVACALDRDEVDEMIWRLEAARDQVFPTTPKGGGK